MRMTYEASVLIQIMRNYSIDINKAYEVYNKISRRERSALRNEYRNN